jgi:hypothetical protein
MRIVNNSEFHVFILQGHLTAQLSTTLTIKFSVDHSGAIAITENQAPIHGVRSRVADFSGQMAKRTDRGTAQRRRVRLDEIATRPRGYKA